MFGGGGYCNDTNYCRIYRPACGGVVQMYWTQWSEGPCLGEGGYCNDANYSGIDKQYLLISFKIGD